MDYGIFPCYDLNAEGLSLDAMLKMTKIKLELVAVADMYMFFEKDTKVGISYISNIYIKSSNKHLNSYIPKQGSKHIYLDTNNLYGYAMSKFLPTSWYKWIDPKVLDLYKYTSSSSKECVLEVDLQYPK